MLTTKQKQKTKKNRKFLPQKQKANQNQTKQAAVTITKTANNIFNNNQINVQQKQTTTTRNPQQITTKTSTELRSWDRFHKGCQNTIEISQRETKRERRRASEVTYKALTETNNNQTNKQTNINYQAPTTIK